MLYHKEDMKNRGKKKRKKGIAYVGKDVKQSRIPWLFAQKVPDSMTSSL